MTDIQRILDAMDRADEWTVNAHYLTHKSGISFWIANGFSFFRCDGLSMGIIGRIKLWQRAKKLRRTLIANALTTTTLTPVYESGQWSTEAQ